MVALIGLILAMPLFLIALIGFIIFAPITPLPLYGSVGQTRNAGHRPDATKTETQRSESTSFEFLQRIEDAKKFT